MKSVRFFCLFAILISMLVLAQSSRVRLPNQQPQQVFPTLSQTPQGATLARRAARASDKTAIRRDSPSSGLSFANAVDYDSHGYIAESVAVADVNGDGKLDLLVANSCTTSTNCTDGTVAVLLGNGDGTFQTAVTYDSGAPFATGIAVADVNGDGTPDLLVADFCASSSNCNGAVAVLLGNGDGTFQTAVIYDSGGYLAVAVAAADVNGDGKPDLIVTNECTSYNSVCTNNLGLVGVLLGNGDGTFQTAVTYGTGGNLSDGLAVADVNGDGKPDVIVASCPGCTNPYGLVGVLLGNGDGTFQAAVTYSSGGYAAFAVAVADVNGDGKPDLLVTNDCANNNCNPKSDGFVGVLLGNGDGTFRTAVMYDSGAQDALGVAVADVNGDGIPDVLVGTDLTSDQGGLGVLLGNGDGTFQTAVTFASGANSADSLAVADVNGDDKPDVMVTNACANSTNCNTGAVGVLINTSLTPTTTTLTSSPNPSNFGEAVTFTATVKPTVWKGMPTGTVSFYNGTNKIGTSNLSSGVATLMTATLPVGTDSITATYNGDSNFFPSTSPVLHQAVQGAIASLSPTSLNFGNQTVGITSEPQKLTLRNKGNINLTISLIQLTGADSGDFNQKNNCPSSLSPNDSCKISVTFTPTTTGTRNAAVSVTDNAPNSPQSVPLTGVGIVPTVTLSPTSLTFPTQLIFTTSKAQSLKLTNTGAGILLIAKIFATGPFRETNDCPSHLKHGEHCTISVKFHPTTKGILHGAVVVSDNAPDSPQKVPLTGTGTYVQLRPAKLHFGVQPVGTKSLAKRVALTNQGHETLNITSISVTGKDDGDFAETNNCGHQVASGASCFIKITFKPLMKGKRMADVSIHDDGGGSPQQASLSGTGT